MGNRAGAGAAPRPRHARHVPALDEPRHLDPRARLGGVPRPVAEAGDPRDDRRRADRQHDARRRRADRRGRARAGDGAPARAARTARLVPRHVAQRRAVPRLGDVRADHHRHRRLRARRPCLRPRRALVLEAALRRHRNVPRAARPDRVRAPLRPQVRDLGRRRVDRSTWRGGSPRTATCTTCGRAAAGAARSSREWI